jgi:hypothetical protein
MEYDAKNDCWVAVTDRLPGAVKGAVCEDADGTIIMLINEKLSDNAKLQAYEHESEHIERSDLHSDKPAHQIEAEMKQ